MTRFFDRADSARRTRGRLLALTIACFVGLPALGGQLAELPSSEGTWLPVLDPAGRPPSVVGTVEIRGMGTLGFEPSEIATQRADVFVPGQFSVFDVLVHLAESGAISMEYAFDPELQTHIIHALNGLEGWWYDAHYEGGSFDRTVARMDQFPVKDGMSIVLYLEDPERLAAIHEHFRDEIKRRALTEGLVVPRVTLRSATSTITFEDVVVSSHDARADVFRPGLTTMLDVLLSLGEQGALDSLGVEPFAMKAFSSLKQNNFDIFKQLLPTIEDTEWAFRTKEPHMSEKQRQRFQKELADFGGAAKVVESTKIRNEKYFRKTRQASSRDFDWNSADFGGVEPSKLKYRVEQGLPFAEVYFYVLSGGKRYLFHINDCYRSPGGWRSPDGIRYRFKVKEESLGSGG